MKRHPVLILPGYGNSGPEHWQTRWQHAHREYRRVEQRDWNAPDCDEWVETLDAAIAACTRPPVLVAHSLAVAQVAQWAARHRRPIHGALLVSPSDVDSPEHTPDAVRGFGPMPLERLPFASIIVVSANDPYVSVERAEQFARAWGSALINIGAAGHINAESGLGDWQQGHDLLMQLR